MTALEPAPQPADDRPHRPTASDAGQRRRVLTADGRYGTLMFVNPNTGGTKVRLPHGAVISPHRSTLTLLDREAVVIETRDLAHLELVLVELHAQRLGQDRDDVSTAIEALWTLIRSARA